MKQPTKYVFLIILTTIAIISGIIFSNIISKEDKEITQNNIEEYYQNIKENIKPDYKENLKNTLKQNTINILLISILGISIIGIITNSIIIYIQGMKIGFLIGTIINKYLFKGIILSIITIIPHYIINIITIIILAHHSNKISKKIINNIITHQPIKTNNIKKYLKITLICLLITTISALIETFISPKIIKLFTFLIK